MNVLSLFDGISCGQVAFDKLGIKFDGVENKYFASEIKKPAIKCCMENYPSTIQIGDITKVSYKDGVLYTENGNFSVIIDMIIGGSPCQNFSQARILSNKNIDGLDGDKSKLFYEYLRLKEEINPKYFLLENVKMNEVNKTKLNEFLGVVGHFIDSKLVSFQKRGRNYWCNFDFTIPNDRFINFQDYKDTNIFNLQEAKVNKTHSRIRMWNNGVKECMSNCKNITHSEKIGCLTRKQDRCPNSGLIEFEDFCRYLTRTEIELAQTLPIGYTNCLSYNQMQDVCGDGWTVNVIAWILSYLPMIDGETYRKQFE